MKIIQTKIIQYLLKNQGTRDKQCLNIFQILYLSIPTSEISSTNFPDTYFHHHLSTQTFHPVPPRDTIRVAFYTNLPKLPNFPFTFFSLAHNWISSIAPLEFSFFLSSTQLLLLFSVFALCHHIFPDFLSVVTRSQVVNLSNILLHNLSFFPSRRCLPSLWDVNRNAWIRQMLKSLNLVSIYLFIDISRDYRDS